MYLVLPLRGGFTLHYTPEVPLVGVRKQEIDEEKEMQEAGLSQFCCAQNSLYFMCSLTDDLSRHSFHPQ